MGEHVSVNVHWPGHGNVDITCTAPSGTITPDELDAISRNVTATIRGLMLPGSLPASELNPWAGVAVMVLHSHTVGQPCDATCQEHR